MSSGNLKKVKNDGGLGSLAPVHSEPTTTPLPAASPSDRPAVLWPGLKPVEVSVMIAASFCLLLLSYSGWWAISITESWGFVTGGICVWLVVREHLWNWPVG